MSDADGQPIVGVDVRLDPASVTVTSAASGGFRFDDLAVATSGSDYQISAAPDGFSRSSAFVQLTPARPSATVMLGLRSIVGNPTPGQETEVLTAVLSGAVGSDEALVFAIYLWNRGSETRSGVVVRDSLDSVFAGTLSESDIVVDRSTFPDARVAVQPDGRSFTVFFGDLEPSDERIEAIRFGVPAPSSAGVYCNVAELYVGEERRASSAGCFSTT